MLKPVSRADARSLISMPEFVTIIALLMALTALSIDIMLPALPAIGAEFSLTDDNAAQAVVTAYMLGFALGQIVYGPLSDSWGRKPLLMAGLVLYGIASFALVFSDSFAFLLAARFVQGFGSAAPRVIAIAAVRDLFGGREMARVMSFVMMVFIIVPVLAPTVGGAILLAGTWHWIFWFMFLVAVIAIAWSALRLPETHPAEKQEPLSMTWLARAAKTTITTRQTVGYTLAIALIFGCLLGYINSAQQIFADIYGVHDSFPVFFGAIAAVLAVASFLNSRLVESMGMRRLSHTALVFFAATGIVHTLLALFWPPSVYVFSAILAINLLAFGFIMPNFNAMAMEPLGRIGGMASSFVGCIQTTGGAVLGYMVGQAYNGTIMPLTLGYAVFGSIALFVVLVTERGRLMQPVNEVSPG